MNNIEAVPHYRSAFRQSDDAEKMVLLTGLRDLAIELLEPVTAKLPRPMSKRIRAIYREKGIGVEWNLKDADDAVVFFLVAKSADISTSSKSAVQLLTSCTHVIEDIALFPRLKDWIFDALGGLEFDNVDDGKKHRTSQKTKAKKPRGKLDYEGATIQNVIRKLALKPEFSDHTSRQLWPEFYSALDTLRVNPKEVRDQQFPNKSAYIYDNAKGNRKSITFGQFANSVSIYRKNSGVPKEKKSG